MEQERQEEEGEGRGEEEGERWRRRKAAWRQRAEQYWRVERWARWVREAEQKQHVVAKGFFGAVGCLGVEEGLGVSETV